MKEEFFDKKIKELADSCRQTPDPEVWDRIESALDRKRRMRLWRNAARFCAAAAVAAGLFATVLLDNSGQEAVQEYTAEAVEPSVPVRISVEEQDVPLRALPGISAGAVAVREDRVLSMPEPLSVSAEDVPEEEDHRTIEYDVFKKLVKRLLTGDDRSRLILKHAPEKLYLLVPAAITMKTLFKRFGVEHVVVSESGVKEGYLYLVLHGKEQGICYDFRSGALSEHPFDSAPEKPVRRRRTRRTAVAQQEPASAEGEKETAAEAELPGNGA